MKFLLDTDVVSQYRKLPPDSRVDAWMQRTNPYDMYISDVTYAELWYGIYRLPAGRRRTALENWIEDELYMQFFNRVVGMNLDVARRYGSILARAEKNGHNPKTMDVLIAAIAAANGMVIATLNAKDFRPLGAEIVEF